MSEIAGVFSIVSSGQHLVSITLLTWSSAWWSTHSATWCLKTPASINPIVPPSHRRPLGAVQVNVLTCTVSPLNMLEAVVQWESWRQIVSGRRVDSLPFEERTPLLLECSQTLQSVFSWYHLGNNINMSVLCAPLYLEVCRLLSPHYSIYLNT